MENSAINSIFEFSLQNESTTDLHREPITLCVPVNCGLTGCDGPLHLIDADTGVAIAGNSVSVISEPGHTCWVTVEFVLALPAEQRIQLAVIKSSAAGQLDDQVVSGDVQLSNAITSIEAYVTDEFGQVHTTQLKNLFVKNDGELGFGDAAAGVAEPTTLQGLIIDAQVKHQPHSAVIDIELMVHNPMPAAHANGLWDIGDKASIQMHEVGITIKHHRAIEIGIDSSSDNKPVQFYKEAKGITVTQIDEGSNLEVERDESVNRVPRVSKTGFSQTLDDRVLEEGQRVNPVGIVRLNESLISVYPLNFWEESPTKLCMGLEESKVVLFGMIDQPEYFLQPGEQKRRRIKVAVTPENHAYRLRQPLKPSFVRQQSEHIVVYSRAVSLTHSLDFALSKLLVTPSEFFSKRDLGGEYGWRNYGEVYADHESYYRKKDEPAFVSHYNNQYDLIYGFAMQYLRTADQHWFALMNDLARHVVDIDIYHTSGDRVEYNHGLFWHTNHYEDAATSTHRTFSIRNYDPNDARSSSGGPGAEHCYTTGLLLHYRLTGDQASRDAVLGLTHWIMASLSGDKCLLGRLHSVAKREVPSVIAKLKGAKTNSLSNYRFAFTRGTGNLVTALLDAFTLEGDERWLREVEDVLSQTFGANDEIELRCLLEVESRWSYTVFLQAVIRYLDVKISVDEIDFAFYRVHQAFVAYTRWMMLNESPYLENPEQLEFANDTWAAQEVRKCVVLRAAEIYDAENKDQYKQLAVRLEAHVTHVLQDSESLKFTRIQAILLQSIGYASAVQNVQFDSAKLRQQFPDIATHEHRTIKHDLMDIAREIKTGITNFNFRNEMKWINTRR